MSYNDNYLKSYYIIYDFIIVVRQSSSLDGPIITVQAIHSLPVRWISIWLAKAIDTATPTRGKESPRILTTTYPEMHVPTILWR